MHTAQLPQVRVSGRDMCVPIPPDTYPLTYPGVCLPRSVPTPWVYLLPHTYPLVIYLQRRDLVPEIPTS